MQLVKPSVTVITEPDNAKRIEMAGRTCYASHDKITPTSAEQFVQNLIDRGHESVLEHSNIIVKANKPESVLWLERLIEEYTRTTARPHFIRHKYGSEDTYARGLDRAKHRCAPCGAAGKVSPGVYVGGEPYFSGNVRAWRSICNVFRNERIFSLLFYGHPFFLDIPLSDVALLTDWDDLYCDVDIVSSAPGDHHNIVTARIVCDRAISHELVRHRLQSFSQTSTRYVKYDDNMEFVEPWWFDGDGAYDHYDLLRCRNVFIDHCKRSCDAYREFVQTGMPAQMARAVLPNALKTEVVVTSTVAEWRAWLRLRDDPAAHPDMRRVAALFKEATRITKVHNSLV